MNRQAFLFLLFFYVFLPACAVFGLGVLCGRGCLNSSGCAYHVHVERVQEVPQAK